MSYRETRREFWAHKEQEAARLTRLERWEEVSNFRFPEVLKERQHSYRIV